MKARYPGTCSATGRRYTEGAEIRKADGGWVLDDNVTRDALAARATATRVFETADRDFFGERVAVVEHSVGDVVWNHDGEVFVIVAVERRRVYDDDIDGHKTVWRWHARPATDDEAAQVVAYLDAVREHETAAARRKDALAALRDLPVQACEAPTSYTAEIALTPLESRGDTYSPPSLDAYVVDGGVVLWHYNPGWDAASGYRLVKGAEAEALARAAALRVVEGDQVAFKVAALPDPPGRRIQ